MKKVEEAFSKEVLASFKNIYMMEGCTYLWPIVKENDKPTIENFKVLAIMTSGEENYETVVLTADDFFYYNPAIDDYDFGYGDEGDYIERGDMPEDVRDFLDEVISTR